MLGEVLEAEAVPQERPDDIGQSVQAMAKGASPAEVTSWTKVRCSWPPMRSRR